MGKNPSGNIDLSLKELPFDAHCHMLNLGYLIPEIAQILYSMAEGNYPGMMPSLKLQSTLPIESKDALTHKNESLLAWLTQIQAAALRSEAANARFIRRAAKKAWRVQDINLVPLMMDIYFLYAPPMTAGESYTQWKEKADAVAEREREALEAAINDESKSSSLPLAIARVKRRAQRVRRKTWLWVRLNLERAAQTIRLKGKDPDFIIDLEHDLETLVERAAKAMGKMKPERKLPFEDTMGFRRQFYDIQDLGKERAGVYPFFAVDPRREGVVDWVIHSREVGRNGPFYGIKLYPRLGYRPDCAALMDLYAFCERESLPIVTHSSSTGFPHWMNEYEDYGYPGNFRAALDKFPKLKLDLAHFGDRSRDDSWADEIALMIRDYENVYSDLSCFTHAYSLETFKSKYQSMPKVMERTMFGSDFDVMFFTNPGLTLEEYYASFRDFFTAGEIEKLACKNPREFLGF